jgi:alpha-acetolactate decarboxylase
MERYVLGEGYPLGVVDMEGDLGIGIYYDTIGDLTSFDRDVWHKFVKDEVDISHKYRLILERVEE